MRAQISAPLRCCALQPSQQAIPLSLPRRSASLKPQESRAPVGRQASVTTGPGISQQSGATLFKSVSSD